MSAQSQTVEFRVYFNRSEFPVLSLIAVTENVEIKSKVSKLTMLNSGESIWKSVNSKVGIFLVRVREVTIHRVHVDIMAESSHACH